MLPTAPFDLDRDEVRRAFERAAAQYDVFAALQREVGERLLARLDLVRLAPGRIVDLGAGTGYCARKLEQRYRDAAILLLDLAPAMLREARKRRRWRSRQHYLCMDAAQLALPGAAVDLVFSNLTLQWCPDLPAVFAECRRVLRPTGLLMFSTLGPDTLRELRAAWAEVDQQPRVNAFLDMHDVGDALIEAGFSSPVLDREHLTLTYDDAFKLMRELKGIGAHNSHLDRRRGMLGRTQLKRMLEAYERFRSAGKLPATYEVVYGHAWAPLHDTRPQDGSTVATFPFSRLTRR